MTAPFSLELIMSDDRRGIVLLTGEMDLATAPELDSAIGALCEAGTEQIEIDLTGLSFIDCSGLRSLLLAADRCTRHDCRLSIIRPVSSQARRLWEITGMAGVLPSPGRERASQSRTGVTTRRVGPKPTQAALVRYAPPH